MRPLPALLLASALATPAPAQRAPAAGSAAAAVDPFIGTGGEGHTYPGATAPFGMVQLSPDTDTPPLRQGYSRAAGYRYTDPTILGFSHTHFSGAGHSDLGDVLVVPVSGDVVKLEPGDAAVPGSGYRSRFSHASERAWPGYYAVTLSDAGVRAEMTAGMRVGVHRYAFPRGRAAHLLVDLRHSIYPWAGKILWSTLRLHPDGTLTGMRETRGWAPGRKLWFAMRFSAQPTGHALVDREGEVAYRGFQGPGRGRDDVAERRGRALVARLDFGRLDRPLEVRVALSGLDEAGALANLAAEPGGFDAVAARTAAAWGQALDRVRIAAAPVMRRSLYTALYHALLAPTVWGDADGRWRGPDGGVHRADGYTQRSTFSLWDTFRAEHPLLTLVAPAQVTTDSVRSLVASQAASPQGLLPVWQFAGTETWTMIGYHAVPVIADAYLKGHRDFDADAALDAMVASASYDQYGGLGDYQRLGYVPIDREPEAASKTVEYAYDDWTVARMARALGRADVARRFEARALNWRNSFDAKSGFLRARLASGAWREPFDPTAINYGSDYTEGNAWQYSWFAPQDLGGLTTALGGDAATVAKLDAMFDFDNSGLDYSHAEDIAGLIGQYIHGNEPSHHVAYLYDYAGAPWRAQERLKQIVDSQYRPTPDGLSGNDDLGQMSAWLLFTAMGFYPVTPGSGEYVIGRPFARSVELTFDDGRRFRIVAEGLSERNRYVGRVTLNGRPLDRVFVRHAEIVAGGELRFTMASRPDRAWGTAVAARPYSMTPYPAR